VGTSRIYLDPARRPELEAKHLLMFSERLPFSREARSFMW